MLQIKRAGHSTLTTPDIERMIGYFTRIVGLSLAAQRRRTHAPRGEEKPPEHQAGEVASRQPPGQRDAAPERPGNARPESFYVVVCTYRNFYLIL